jgi:hypothetical protein
MKVAKRELDFQNMVPLQGAMVYASTGFKTTIFELGDNLSFF